MKSFFIPRLFSVFAPILLGGLVSAQVLTLGPVVGGVTSSEARVFVRTNRAANVALFYGTDPNLYTHQVSQSFLTNSAHDFTRIIPLSGLSPDRAAVALHDSCAIYRVKSRVPRTGLAWRTQAGPVRGWRAAVTAGSRVRHNRARHYCL